MFSQNLRVTSWHPISHSQLFVLHSRYLWIPSMSHLFHFEPILTGLPGFGCGWSVIHISILKQDAVHLFHLGKEMPTGTPVHPQGAKHALSCSSCSHRPLHSIVLHRHGQLPEMWQFSSLSPHQLSGMASATAANGVPWKAEPDMEIGTWDLN